MEKSLCGKRYLNAAEMTSAEYKADYILEFHFKKKVFEEISKQASTQTDLVLLTISAISNIAHILKHGYRFEPLEAATKTFLCFSMKKKLSMKPAN